ncbi:MAG: methyl-accepting chemotaxis protein [Treponema sp.]|jgi:methyl-accepting chemotaxis protein|nr:methyl-accepting chemotaxis protein [Treponema sp.]
MRLKARLTLIVGSLTAVFVAGVAIVLLVEAKNLQTIAVMENMEHLTGLYATQLQGGYSNYLSMSKAVADIMSSYEEVPAEERRAQYDFMLKGIIEANPDFFGLFAIWKPNAIDGNDAEYAYSVGTDSTGRYMPWFRQTSGSVEKLPLSDYELYNDVIANMDSTAPFASTPYYVQTSSGEKLAFRLCYPVIVDGAIVGRTGIMINLTPGQEIVNSIKSYNTGRTVLYSNDGTIIAHYDPSMIAKNISDPQSVSILGEQSLNMAMTALKTGEPTSGSAKGRIFEMYPFYLGGVNIEEVKTPWLLLSSVEESDVLSTVIFLMRIAVIVTVFAILVSVGVIFFVVDSTVTRRINVVADAIKDISEGEGDLTRRLVIHKDDEIGVLGVYFNQTMERIRVLVVSVKKQSIALFDIGNELASNMTETAAAVNQINANIQSIKARVMHQSTSVNETNAIMEQITENINKLNTHVNIQSANVAASSSAIEQMIANIQSVTQTLIKNADNVKKLMEASEVGKTGLQEVSADIQNIARESEGLLAINAVMENIASQTNLLSMNAAIEAAHAGEVGKGFAVVAAEIRKLAENSGEQSKTISAVLKKIKDSIVKISSSTDNVLNKFEAIDSGIRVVSIQEENIRNAMEEQGSGSKQILESINQLNNVTQIVKSGSDEMNEGSKQVIAESKNLSMVTQEITNGMNEMASGADQINAAVNKVNSISEQNKENIDVLVKEVSKFKVE